MWDAFYLLFYRLSYVYHIKPYNNNYRKRKAQNHRRKPNSGVQDRKEEKIMADFENKNNTQWNENNAAQNGASAPNAAGTADSVKTLRRTLPAQDITQTPPIPVPAQTALQTRMLTRTDITGTPHPTRMRQFTAALIRTAAPTAIRQAAIHPTSTTPYLPETAATATTAVIPM